MTKSKSEVSPDNPEKSAEPSAPAGSASGESEKVSPAETVPSSAGTGDVFVLNITKTTVFSDRGPIKSGDMGEASADAARALVDAGQVEIVS